MASNATDSKKKGRPSLGAHGKKETMHGKHSTDLPNRSRGKLLL
ncbi:hypothetical protein ES703_47086 [subsurface metagenome]